MESEGNYLEVHQFDAHAWVEYLDEQNRWQRLDPTAAVAPAHRGGMPAALVASSPPRTPLPAALSQLGSAQPVALVGANLDYQWTRWVLNYDAASLWQQLGQRWPVLAGHTHWLILAALLG